MVLCFLRFIFWLFLWFLCFFFGGMGCGLMWWCCSIFLIFLFELFLFCLVWGLYFSWWLLEWGFLLVEFLSCWLFIFWFWGGCGGGLFGFGFLLFMVWWFICIFGLRLWFCWLIRFVGMICCGSLIDFCIWGFYLVFLWLCCLMGFFLLVCLISGMWCILLVLFGWLFLFLFWLVSDFELVLWCCVVCFGWLGCGFIWWCLFLVWFIFCLMFGFFFKVRCLGLRLGRLCCGRIIRRWLLVVLGCWCSLIWCEVLWFCLVCMWLFMFFLFFGVDVVFVCFFCWCWLWYYWFFLDWFWLVGIMWLMVMLVCWLVGFFMFLLLGFKFLMMLLKVRCWKVFCWGSLWRVCDGWVVWLRLIF